jgi:hypothetical protein
MAFVRPKRMGHTVASGMVAVIQRGFQLGGKRRFSPVARGNFCFLLKPAFGARCQKQPANHQTHPHCALFPSFFQPLHFELPLLGLL